MNKEENINNYIESESMKKHLIKNIDLVNDYQLTDIICGARKAIEQKCMDLKLLSNDCVNEHIKEALEAVNGLSTTSNEIFLIGEKGFDLDITEEKLYGCEPVISLEKALELIKKDWDYCTNEENADRTDWYELEKYILDENNDMKHISTYTIAPNGEIWFYRKIQNKAYNKHLSLKGLDLYLPIPFEIGNILTIDCRPFSPIKHGVLLEKGNDCCTVTCAWIEEKSDTINVGSIMHNTLFTDRTCDMSALYRLEIYSETLSERESILYSIAEYVKGNKEKGCDMWEYISHRENVDFESIINWIGERNNASILKKAYEQYIIHKDLMDRLAD